MALYLRKKSDGFVYDHNPMLASMADMEVFEFDGTPPEILSSLDELIAKPARKKRSDKAETPGSE